MNVPRAPYYFIGQHITLGTPTILAPVVSHFGVRMLVNLRLSNVLAHQGIPVSNRIMKNVKSAGL